MREKVTEACVASISKNLINVNYSVDLNCLNKKGRVYIQNPLAHSFYLDIRYLKAVKIMNFLKGVFIQKEVKRINGDTVCRLICGYNNTYKVVFFDVEQARIRDNFSNQKGGFGFFSKSLKNAKLSNPAIATMSNSISKSVNSIKNTSPKQVTASITNGVLSTAKTIKNNSAKLIGAKISQVVEDIKMDKEAFIYLIEKMMIITDKTEYCPIRPNNNNLINPFKNNIKMPNLSCFSNID
jgi:uncharacterized protein YbcI